MRNILTLLRVKQWVKNAFIFFPLLFSGRFFVPSLRVDCFETFLGFCLISSSMYILNDYLDRKVDSHHPKKAKRALIHSKLNKPTVISLILLLELGGLLIAKSVSNLILIIFAFYIIFNLIYNFFAKRVVILDVIFIAIGFHLRIIAGSLAAQVIPSVWLQMCVFLLALFLGFTKRRYEISALKEKATEHRRVLEHYTSYLLDQIIMICSTLAIVFYGLYTISSEIVRRIGSLNMLYSVIFVIYGIFRYLYLIHVKKLGDEPGDILMKDIPFLINIILWIAYVGSLIYFPRLF